MLSNKSIASKSSLIIVAAVVFATVLALLPATDTLGRDHVDSAFKRALAVAAIARALNGVISVAQGTELAIQPAGVGVNFTPGEILDPINDLVERFSWIMLLATSSLGVQKILLAMSAWEGLLLALLVVALTLIASHFFLKSEAIKAVLGRVFLFLLLLRFMMPMIAIANDLVYRVFLETDYVNASAELQTATDEIGELNKQVSAGAEPPEGIVDKARELYRQLSDQIDLEQRYTNYRQAASSVGENSVNLIVVFIMQTLVFPLLFLFIVISLLRRITRWRWRS